jgi:hypothetical protein
MAKRAKGGALRAKRIQSGNKAKAMMPVLPPDVQNAFDIVY